MSEHNITPESSLSQNKDSENGTFNPKFGKNKKPSSNIDRNELLTAIKPTNLINNLTKVEPLNHDDVIENLLKSIERVDFREKASLKKEDEKVFKKHYLIICIEEILTIAKKNEWGLCKSFEFIYLFNSAYWSVLDKNVIENFLGDAALKMGIDKYDALHFNFKDQLFKQFISSAKISKPFQQKNSVLINLINGTFEITPNKQFLRKPDPKDFLKYQLPFNFDPKADLPIFRNYLNRVLPDKDCQKVLSEYVGSLFIKQSTLKLEKALLLYGTGANGKSVFFDIITALLGGDSNVCSYTLQSLTDDNGYYRASLANYILNYASEISVNMKTDKFKSLISGEPIEARLPNCPPFILKNYAKFIFNCNILPKDVEQTTAFYRRFIIIPFECTIPENEQDPELGSKIIRHELSGVFNWVLEGLRRLLEQKSFTESAIVKKQIDKYKMESDKVMLFLDEEGFTKSYTFDESITLKELYNLYKAYCSENYYHPFSNVRFKENLNNLGYELKRVTGGWIVAIKKI